MRRQTYPGRAHSKRRKQLKNLERTALAFLAVAIVSFLIGGVYTKPSSADSHQDIVVNMSAPSPDKTISLSTIVKAINASGLAGTLKGTGPYTFFAPNDAAFNALPAGTWDAVMNDQAKLKEFLMNLVVKGSLSRDDLRKNGAKFTTLGGATLESRLSSGQVYINDGKKSSVIVRGPTEGSNGAIYVLGGVPGL
jgi:uncharacterized surface protein with fasciclin (FAS1) repeats